MGKLFPEKKKGKMSWRELADKSVEEGVYERGGVASEGSSYLHTLPMELIFHIVPM